MALLDLFSYACGVDSVGMIPPRWSTRGVRPRSALAKTAVLCTASFSFAHTVPRFMRRGMGRGSRRWSTRGVRPLWALAKTPCADGAARSFFLCLRSCKHGAGIRKTPALLRSEAFLLVGAERRNLYEHIGKEEADREASPTCFSNCST